MSNKTLTLKEKSASVRDLLMQYEEQMKAVLPKHLTAERMVNVAMAAMLRQPKLLDCSKASLLQAVMAASELGFDMNPVMGHCAIIPYKDVATFQPMYKGLVDLAYRSGRVTKIDSHIVHTNDEFEYSYGLHPDLKHKPATGDRGEKIGAYVVAHIRDMDPTFLYMSKQEIEDHRNKYSRSWKKDGMNSVWGTSPDPMWQKTVFIQLCRWLPKSPEMVDLEKAIALDNRAETGRADIPTGTIDVNIEEIPDVDALDAVAEQLDGDLEMENEIVFGE